MLPVFHHPFANHRHLLPAWYLAPATVVDQFLTLEAKLGDGHIVFGPAQRNDRAILQFVAMTGTSLSDGHTLQYDQ